MGDRLTVGLWVLVPAIGVRIPVPQPERSLLKIPQILSGLV